MKNLFIFFMLFCLVFSCKKDESLVFDASISEGNIRFEPFPGGATMYYELPDNSDIYLIQAEYKDHNGKQVKVKGTYLNDNIQLYGFVNEETEIPVSICLLDKNENQSKKLDMSFSTKQCAASAFFNDLKVSKFWSGFKINYKAPEVSDGFVHVGYIGTNKMTQTLDTLLIGTYPIKPGDNLLPFMNYCNKETQTTTAVVWTEDYRGNIVDKKVFKDVPAVMSEEFPNTNFTFDGSSEEAFWYSIGTKYLFDGDKKGKQRIVNWGYDHSYYFVSQPNAVPGNWILDIKEAKVLAGIRIYASLNTAHSWIRQYWNDVPEKTYPNHVKVYASNDPDASDEEWTYMGEFYQSGSISAEKSWIYPCINRDKVYYTGAEFDAAEPAFMEVPLDYIEKKFRYVKLEILEVFHNIGYSDYNFNTENRVSFVELEVFVKKEDN